MNSEHDKNKVYYIDNIPTTVTSIHGNILKGFMIDIQSFVKKPCYVIIDQGYAAHGSTIREAVKSLQEKIFNNLSDNDRIDMFVKHFKKDMKYTGTEFFDWHNKLTLSCLLGRQRFIEQHKLSLTNTYSVIEFIEICSKEYGSNIINKLRKHYE